TVARHDRMEASIEAAPAQLPSVPTSWTAIGTSTRAPDSAAKSRIALREESPSPSLAVSSVTTTSVGVKPVEGATHSHEGAPTKAHAVDTCDSVSNDSIPGYMSSGLEDFANTMGAV